MHILKTKMVYDGVFKLYKLNDIKFTVYMESGKKQSTLQFKFPFKNLDC